MSSSTPDPAGAPDPEHPGGRIPVRCEDCGRSWRSAAAQQLITLEGGCLVCGGAVSDAAGG